jgi:hypothetical protein
MEYVIYLLLSIAVIVAFIQMLFVENFELPAKKRSKCPTGCSYSRYSSPTKDEPDELCSRLNSSGSFAYDSGGNMISCPLLDKCPDGDTEKNGECLYCDQGLTLKGELCVKDNGTAAPVLSPVGAPSCKIENFADF